MIRSGTRAATLAASRVYGVFRRRFLSGCVASLAGPSAGSATGSTLPPDQGTGNLWAALPPTPGLPPSTAEARVTINDAEIFFARYGQGDPVILLHAGLGSSDYWGNQIPELAKRQEVLVIDTRGHGRSTLSAGPLTFELMASDVVAVMDHLDIRKAAIVGWSDGAITGLSLAMSHPDRVNRLFLFGANFRPDGLIASGSRTPVFQQYAARTAQEYQTLSPDPRKRPQLVQQLTNLWRTAPTLSLRQLGSVRAVTLVVDGDHDEIIRPAHTRQLAASIASAKVLILPGVSHFAMLQNPAQFSTALVDFLGQ